MGRKGKQKGKDRGDQKVRRDQKKPKKTIGEPKPETGKSSPTAPPRTK